MIPLARVLDEGEPCPTVAAFSSRHERGALVPVRDPYGRERSMPALEVARTVIAGHGDRMPPVDQDGLIRSMEWQEAALLQGFDENYVFAASWSRTWKLVAQAIPICVGRAILESIMSQENKP